MRIIITAFFLMLAWIVDGKGEIVSVQFDELEPNIQKSLGYELVKKEAGSNVRFEIRIPKIAADAFRSAHLVIKDKHGKSVVQTWLAAEEHDGVTAIRMMLSRAFEGNARVKIFSRPFNVLGGRPLYVDNDPWSPRPNHLLGGIAFPLIVK